MSKLNQRGVIHLLIPIILIIGLIAAVWLVTSGNPLKLFSKATLSQPVGPETSLSLVGPDVCTGGWVCIFEGKPQPQEEFAVKVYARSDIETANLFEAKMTFPKDLVDVVEIKLADKFNEVENYYDNSNGEISIVGGVPAPGLQTQQNGPSVLMATITFKAKTLGKGTVSFTDASSIYSNLNNIDILTTKRGYDVSVEVAPPPPTPSPTASPSNNTSYDVGVLVLKYFPLDNTSQNLNSPLTGMEDTLASIRSKVDRLTSEGFKKLTTASKYHGYKNPSATPALNFIQADSKEYLTAIPISNNKIPWNPSVYRPDYMKMLTDLNICDYVDNQNVKEVWVWGYHHGLIEPVEGNMAMGTTSRSHWNHGSYGDVSNSEQINDMPVCSKTYTLMNFNYSRDLGEMLEDYTHNIEANMKFVDSALWSRFVDPHGISGGTVNHCGWTHSPPNVTDANQYLWNSETTVKSDCEDWKPDGGGQVKDINCHTWFGATCPDNGGIEFKIWWMQNIPGMNNDLTYQGKTLRNWWDFIGDFDNAIQNPTLLVSNVIPTPSPAPTSTPIPGPKGDGNKDGKVNLIDMSVLHTDYLKDKLKGQTLHDGIDMNNDGLINVNDFAALRQMLQDLKVVRVK